MKKIISLFLLAVMTAGLLCGCAGGGDGNIILSMEYEYDLSIEEPFSEGLLCLKNHDKYGFVDKKGNIVVPLEYDYANSFDEGLAAVVKRKFFP